MSDDLSELLETKPKGDKPKTPHHPESQNPQEKNSSPTRPDPSLADLEVTYSPSRITNYKTLKALGAVLKIFAYGSGAGGVISIIVALGYATQYFRYGVDIEFYIFLFIGTMGILTALSFAFLSESINVLLDIEANSRQAAKTLGRILKSQ